jgi:hypothetical protein
MRRPGPISDCRGHRDLQHRHGPTLPDEAACRDREAGAQHHPVGAEEVDVEGEPHAKGVDRGAAGNQEARSGVLEIEVGKSQEAGAQAGRDRHLAIVDKAVREAIEAGGGHRRPKVWATQISPPYGIRDFWHDFIAKIPSHCNPAFRGVPGEARN